MPKVKVLRLLEYTYASFEAYEKDRVHWAVQGHVNKGSVVIKSAVLPFEVLDDEG
jgi:hypothetical protein